MTIEPAVVNGNRRSGVRRLDLLDALHESNQPGNLTKLVEGVSRLAGARWTRITWDGLMASAGVARGTIARLLGVSIEMGFIERRPCKGKCFEYRIAERFHRRRNAA